MKIDPRQQPLIWVLGGLLLVSLALHGWTIWTLTSARAMLKTQLETAVTELHQAESATITLQVPIKQSIPISAKIPIAQQITVPVNTTVRIDQNITIPINTPLGNTSYVFPLKVDVPINASVPVSINETVPISTSVALDLRIPVTVSVGEPPLSGYMARLQRVLRQLIEEL